MTPAPAGRFCIKYWNHENPVKFGELDIVFNYSEEKNTQEKRRRRIPENFNGKLSIKYTDYKVNEGIDDSVFVDESGDGKKSSEAKN